MARQHFNIEVSPRTYNLLGRAMAMSGNVITLEDHRDAARFHIGMDLRAGVAPNQLRSGSFRVITTNEDNGTVAVIPALGVKCFCSGDNLYWSAADQQPP